MNASMAYATEREHAFKVRSAVLAKQQINALPDSASMVCVVSRARVRPSIRAMLLVAVLAPARVSITPAFVPEAEPAPMVFARVNARARSVSTVCPNAQFITLPVVLQWATWTPMVTRIWL